MAKADIQAGRAYVSLYAKGSELTKALNKAKRELVDFGTGIMKIGASVSGMGLAVTGGLAAATAQFATTGAAIQRLATQTGVSASELSALQFAAIQTGAEFDDISGALEEVNIRMGEVTRDGTGPAAEAFKTLGLDAQELGKMLPIDRLMEIGEALSGVQDAAMRQFLADEVIGGDAFRILPLLVQGRQGMEDLMQAGRDLGVVLTDEDARAASQLTQAFNRLRAVTQGVINQIGASLAPLAMELAESFTSVASAVVKFVRDNRNLVIIAAKVGAVLTVVGTAIVAIGAGFVGAGLAISGVLSAIAAFGSIASVAVAVMGALVAGVGLLLSPFGLLVGVLVAAGVAWARFTQDGRTQISGFVSFGSQLLGSLRQTFGETFAGIAEALRSGNLALAGQIAMVGLRLAVTQGVEAIHQLFGETMGTLADQILNGDIAGAWSTLGAVILNTWAGITDGIVQYFVGAANSVTRIWRQAVDEITNMILQQAGQGGIFGKAFEAISGVNVAEEMKRSQALEQQRRDKGLNPQSDDIASQIAAGTYKDPGIAAIEQRVNETLAAVSEASSGMVEATQAAVNDAVGGRSQEASDRVKALQQELANLRNEAQQTIATGKAEGGGGLGLGGAGDIGGRASAASFNLLSLMTSKTGEQKQIGILGKIQEANGKQLDKMDEQIAAINRLGLFHT